MKHLQYNDNNTQLLLILNFVIDVKVLINQYYILNYPIKVKTQLMIEINLSYELDDHFLDDVKEEIDLIFEMFVYNKYKLYFYDQLKV